MEGEQQKPERPEQRDALKDIVMFARTPEARLNALADETVDSYLRNEKASERIIPGKNIENSTSSIDANLGYLPYFERLIAETNDESTVNLLSKGGYIDNAEAEENLLRHATFAVRDNLKVLSAALDEIKDKNTPSYRKLRAFYLERNMKFAELIGGVSEVSSKSEGVREPQLASHEIAKVMSRLNTDEAIDWARNMMMSMDERTWQSAGQKEAYGRIANTCKLHIAKKMAVEKQESLTNPDAGKLYTTHCIEVAKLFTDRSSPIPNGLADPDFGSSMAREGMQFDGLALRYAQENLGQRNWTKEIVQSHLSDIKTLMAERLPPETLENPEVKDMLSILEGDPKDIQSIAKQYTIARQLRAMLRGDSAPDVKAELNDLLARPIEKAYGKFEIFLGKVTGNLLTPGAPFKNPPTLEVLQKAIGNPPLTKDQIESWKLLVDIEGYGGEFSDKQWQAVALGAKIGASIAAGVAIGVATGGLGVVGAAIVGGAAMTATNVALNQQGFDSEMEATSVIGKDFGTNALTFGASRYLSAGRTAYQGVQNGTLQSTDDVILVFKKAGESGGMKYLNELDEATPIATRLVGATFEASGDVLVGTTLDTVIQGGSFTENLQNNAMFFGLGYAEFVTPSALRQMRGLSDADLHGLEQTMHRAELGRMQLEELCKGTNLTPFQLVQSPDPAKLLGDMKPAQAKEITDVCMKLRDAKQELSAVLQKASSIEVPSKRERLTLTPDEVALKEKILSLPDTEEGLAERRALIMFGMKMRFGKEPTPEQVERMMNVHGMEFVPTEATQYGELAAKLPSLEADGVLDHQKALFALDMGFCGKKGPPPPPPPPPRRNGPPNDQKKQPAAAPRVGPPPPPPPPIRSKQAAAESLPTPALPRGPWTIVSPDALVKNRQKKGLGSIEIQSADGKKMFIPWHLMEKTGGLRNGSVITIPESTIKSLLNPQAPKSTPASTPVVSKSTPASTPRNQPKTKPGIPTKTPGAPLQVIKVIPNAKNTVTSPLIQKASAIACEKVPVKFSPELATMLGTTIKEAEIGVLNHVKYENKERVLGYVVYGNERAVTSSRKSDIYPRSYEHEKGVSQAYMHPGNGVSTKEARNLLVTSRLDYANPTAVTESVSLSKPLDGKRKVTYLYFSPGFTESIGGRKGVQVGVTVLLPEAQAEALFQKLKAEPAAARAFFVAAGQDVHRSEYLWNERRPNYEQTEPHRALIFAEENAPTSNKPPLDLHYMTPGNQGWQETSFPNEYKEAAEEALAAAEKSRVGDRNRAATPPKPPKKSWWQWLTE